MTSSTELFEHEAKELFLRLAQVSSGRDSALVAAAALLHAAAHAGCAGLSRERFLCDAAAQYDRVARCLDDSDQAAA